MRTAVVLLALLLAACGAHAFDTAPLAAQLQALARDARAGAPARVEVEVGSLDPRLKLQPCARIEPKVPTGTRLWGPSRIALRCVDGPTKWQVWLPITVKVFGPALVARAPLAAGASLHAGDFITAEVDLAAGRGDTFADTTALIGRTLAQPLGAGEALREPQLQPRSWFAAGDAVRVLAGGPGWRIVGEGVALAPGLEGRSVRVRTPAGRIVSGRATGPRTIEVTSL
jgi:flagella basal body P-ring formation protein FlgA